MGAAILSQKEIIKRVKDHDIKISYYSIPGYPKGNYEVIHDDSVLDNQQCAAWKHFMKSLEPDCLQLTVGPYALVEHKHLFRYLFEQIPFFGRKFIQRKDQEIFNIYESGSITFYPGENIIIGTNEEITVNNKIGASLYAAVRNTDVGLPHISTTIDPGWTGRLQIGIVNSTRSEKEFEFMEKICKVRFHEFDHECPPLKDKPHSLSWSEIENDNTKAYFPRGKQSKSRQQLKRLYSGGLFKIIAFLLTAIGAVVGATWSIGGKFHDIEDYFDNTFKKQDHRFELMEKSLDIKKLETQVELMKQTKSTQKHITFNKKIGVKEKRFDISFGRKYKEEPSVFLMTDNNGVRYNIRVLPSAGSSDISYQSAEISAWLEKGTAPEEQDINFDLFIVE